MPTKPWERIHIDHAQWGKYLLLIAIDAFAKWLEVHVVSSISASQTIDKLRAIFATHGVPVTIVSDNKPPFTSSQFERQWNFTQTSATIPSILKWIDIRFC